jgi:hypothetical protein
MDQTELFVTYDAFQSVCQLNYSIEVSKTDGSGLYDG